MSLLITHSSSITVGEDNNTVTHSCVSENVQYCRFLTWGCGEEFDYTGMFVESGMLHTHYRDYDWRTHRWDRENPMGYVEAAQLTLFYPIPLALAEGIRPW